MVCNGASQLITSHLKQICRERPQNFLPAIENTLEKFNLYHRISFIPVTVAHVEGLPHGTETSSEVSFPLYSLLRHAMDLTEPAVESLLQELKPHFVFFDFTHWLPDLTRRLGMKSVYCGNISPLAVAYLFRDESTVEDLMDPPPDFPTSGIKIYTHEARAVSMINNMKEFGSGMKYVPRMIKSDEECDAIGFKSCIERKSATPFYSTIDIYEFLLKDCNHHIATITESTYPSSDNTIGIRRYAYFQ